MGEVFLLEEDQKQLEHLSVRDASTTQEMDSIGPMSPRQKLVRAFGAPKRLIEKKFSPGSLKGSVFTIIASTIGAGILTLPYAINLAGLYLGIFLFIAGFVVSLYTCQLLVIVSDLTSVPTYEGVGEHLYGPKMRTFSEINMIINNYGTYIAYVVLLKSLGPHAFRLLGINEGLLDSDYAWGIIITTAIVYPLSIAKKISVLRFTSVLSCGACIYLSIVVTAEFFDLRRNEIGNRFEDASPAEFTAYSIFEVCPLVVFAYTCHPNVLLIYTELQRRTPGRGYKFLMRGLVTVMIIYIIVGVFGFLTFYKEYHGLDNFPSNILSAKYPHGNAPVIISSFTMFITVLCGAPLLMHPCRDATLSLVYKGKEYPRSRYLILVTILVFSGMGLALIIPNIALVLTLLGSVSNPIICFILPCMFYMKAKPGKWTRPDLFICWAVMIIMSLIGVMGFIMFWCGLAGYTF